MAAAGCDNRQPSACYIPEILPAPADYSHASGADWGARIDSCVHHWSRSLAASPDSPYAVTDAVMHVCDIDFPAQAQALNRELPNIYPDVDATEKKLRDDERGEALAEIEAFREARCKGPDDPQMG